MQLLRPTLRPNGTKILFALLGVCGVFFSNIGLAEFRPKAMTDSFLTSEIILDPQCHYRLRIGSVREAQYLDLTAFNSVTTANGLSTVSKFHLNVTPGQAAILIGTIFTGSLQFAPLAQTTPESVMQAKGGVSIFLMTHSSSLPPGWPTALMIQASGLSTPGFTHVMGVNKKTGYSSVLEQECGYATPAPSPVK